MSQEQTNPSHITTGNVFDDLGFLPAEAAMLKSKVKILSSLLNRIHKRRYTETQLARILGDDQPNISNLLDGKISRISKEKLLNYSTRLSLDRS
jgi:predicted XRE-type DNA-binding protein